MKQNQIALIGILVAAFGIVGIFVVNTYIARPEDRKGEVRIVEEISEGFDEKGLEIASDPDRIDFFVQVQLEELNNPNPVVGQ